MNQRVLDVARQIAARRACDPVQVVTAAFPFVPARIGLPHFASTYLPADTQARLTRLLGGRAVLVGGTDVHSITLSRDGKTRAGIEEACAQWDDEYRRAYAQWQVRFDAYLRTDDQDHKETTHEALRRLEEQGALVEAATSVLICDDCGAAPPPRMTRSADGQDCCPWCGSTTLRQQQRSHLFLDLEQFRPAIEGTLALEKAPSRWLSGVLEHSLDRWCLTRDNLVGMDLHRNYPGRSLYLWFDSLAGYVTLARRLGLGQSSEDEFEFRHVFGKNIIFHHGIIWPVILRRGFGMGARISGHVRGFVMGQADWVDDATDMAALRLFVLFKTPDTISDCTLPSAEFLQFKKRVVENKVLNLLSRLGLAAQRGPAEPVIDLRWEALVADALNDIDVAVQRGCVQAATRRIIALIRECGGYAVDRGLLWNEDPGARWQAAEMRRIILAFLGALSPGFVPRVEPDHQERVLADVLSDVPS